MTRLVLVRHGKALDVAGRCIGRTDVPLSAEGARAIRGLVENGIQSLDLRLDGRTRLISSDLRRAVESANILAAAMGRCVEHDIRLREIDFGEWDGRSWSEIERADPERLRCWLERWAEVAAPGGEGVGDLLRRAAGWIGDIVTPRELDEVIVVVSHAGWIRAAVSHLLGRDIASMFDIPVDHASATIIDVGAAGGARCRPARRTHDREAGVELPGLFRWR